MSSDWQTFVDKKTGVAYYHNSKTNETTWEKPAELPLSRGDSLSGLVERQNSRSRIVMAEISQRSRDNSISLPSRREHVSDPSCKLPPSAANERKVTWSAVGSDVGSQAHLHVGKSSSMEPFETESGSPQRSPVRSRHASLDPPPPMIGSQPSPTGPRRHIREASRLELPPELRPKFEQLVRKGSLNQSMPSSPSSPSSTSTGAKYSMFGTRHRSASTGNLRSYRTYLRSLTLFYRDDALEHRFRQDLAKRVQRRARPLAVSMLLIVLVSCIHDILVAEERSDKKGTLYTQLYLDAVAFVFSVLSYMLAKCCNTSNLAMAYLHALTASIVGFALVARTTYQQEDQRTIASSASVIAFLTAFHIFAKLIFPVIFLSSSLISLVFIVTAWMWRWSGADSDELWAQSVYLVLANGFLCSASYEFELYRRHSYIKRRLVEEERDYLRRKAEHAQMKVQSLLGWTDSDAVTLNFQSPMEEAMNTLRGLALSDDLSPGAVVQLQTAISLLGKHSDLFQPQFDAQIKDKHLDSEVETFLYGLIDNPIRTNSDSLARGSLSAHSSPALSPGSTSPSNNRLRASTSTARKMRKKSYWFGIQAMPLAEEVKHQWVDILDGIDDWSFDIFGCDKLTKGHPLQLVGYALFRRYDLIDKFDINPQTLRTFLSTIEKGYHDNPYHNRIHAADVTQTTHCFLEVAKVNQFLVDDMEVLAALVAAMVHDFDHPGTNNNYLIAMQDPLAVLYNDKSVLENHHLAVAFQRMRLEENNITASFTRQQYSTFRKIVIEMVLATDLAHHFEFVGHFRQSLSRLQDTTAARASDKEGIALRNLMLKMTLKCADISHSFKNLETHKRWTENITEEFYQQGDKERDMGLPISAFMDRAIGDVPKSQIGFINFLVRPMLGAYYEVLPSKSLPCLECLDTNYQYWADQKSKSKEPTPQVSRVQSRSISRHSRKPINAQDGSDTPNDSSRA